MLVVDFRGNQILMKFFGPKSEVHFLKLCDILCTQYFTFRN